MVGCIFNVHAYRYKANILQNGDGYLVRISHVRDLNATLQPCKHKPNQSTATCTFNCVMLAVIIVRFESLIVSFGGHIPFLNLFIYLFVDCCFLKPRERLYSKTD